MISGVLKALFKNNAFSRQNMATEKHAKYNQLEAFFFVLETTRLWPERFSVRTFTPLLAMSSSYVPLSAILPFFMYNTMSHWLKYWKDKKRRGLRTTWSFPVKNSSPLHFDYVKNHKQQTANFKGTFCNSNFLCSRISEKFWQDYHWCHADIALVKLCLVLQALYLCFFTRET